MILTTLTKKDLDKETLVHYHNIDTGEEWIKWVIPRNILKEDNKK
jgi:hypothetical protein